MARRRKRVVGRLRPHLVELEPRRLLSAVAQPSCNVSFDDLGSAQAAFYAGLTRVIQAAGHEWGQLFDSAASIDVTVRFDPTLATAYGRSLRASYLYHSADGLDIYEQGAASEINTGIDPNGAAADVEIVIGTQPGANYLADTLWFDPNPASRSADIPDGKVDAQSVMMQALGHAIAYNGWRDWSTGQLPSTYASTFDQYIYQSGSDFLFSGAFAHEVYGADPALMAGSLYLWGTAGTAPGADLPNQLMNGVSLAAQTRYEISSLDVAVMYDIGMNMRITPPAVVNSQFLFDTSQRITVQFDESVRTSLDASDFTLTRVGPGAATTIPEAAIDVVYDRTTNIATLSFPGLSDGILPDGNYQLSINAAGIKDLAGNAMTADASLNFFTLAGDADHDRTVGFSDLVAVAQNYGKTSGVSFPQGDFNYDGVVDFSDLVTVAQRYGTTLAEPAPAADAVAAAFVPAPVFAVSPVTSKAAKPKTAPLSKTTSKPLAKPVVSVVVPPPPAVPIKRQPTEPSLFSVTQVTKSKSSTSKATVHKSHHLGRR
jgi:hypothetical protein